MNLMHALLVFIFGFVAGWALCSKDQAALEAELNELKTKLAQALKGV